MTRPGSGTIPSTERSVMLLPEPDSPTMPFVAPSSTSKLTPFAANAAPCAAGNAVFRFRTSSSALTLRPRRR